MTDLFTFIHKMDKNYNYNNLLLIPISFFTIFIQYVYFTYLYINDINLNYCKRCVFEHAFLSMTDLFICIHKMDKNTITMIRGQFIVDSCKPDSSPN